MKVWLARCTVVKAIPFKLLNFVLLTEIYCVTAAQISSFRARKKSAASASSVTYSDSAGTAVTRSLDSDSEAPTSASSFFTNNMARKFLNQMDDLCGCPCGCSDAKILDDNLPKYI